MPRDRAEPQGGHPVPRRGLSEGRMELRIQTLLVLPSERQKECSLGGLQYQTSQWCQAHLRAEGRLQTIHSIQSLKNVSQAPALDQVLDTARGEAHCSFGVVCI